MRSACVATVALLLFVMPTSAQDSVPKKIQDVSVTILSPGWGEGSGVVCVTKDKTCWVLTAAHVVQGLREEREIIDSKTGGKKVAVSFRDAKVIRHLVEDGRTVGRLELDAEVIRYSSVDHHDLALLRVRKREMLAVGCIFYLEDKLPEVGTDLLHCGSLLGQFGSNSLTAGILSKHGRLINGYVYDQTSCPSFPGSSGGGTFLKADGRYVGMLVRGAGETFSLIVPVRRIKDWAKAVGIDFVIDPSVPLDEKFRERAVEDSLK